MSSWLAWLPRIFLPTPSARRATRSVFGLFQRQAISTHALREEGDGPPYIIRRLAPLISTHALREEGDVPFAPAPAGGPGFLPTPSARRATASTAALKPSRVISTHALREEGDASFRAFCWASASFLPTPSARRATEPYKVNAVPQRISTHALREEGDGSSTTAPTT